MNYASERYRVPFYTLGSSFNLFRKLSFPRLISNILRFLLSLSFFLSFSISLASSFLPFPNVYLATLWRRRQGHRET